MGCYEIRLGVNRSPFEGEIHNAVSQTTLTFCCRWVTWPGGCDLWLHCSISKQQDILPTFEPQVSVVVVVICQFCRYQETVNAGSYASLLVFTRTTETFKAATFFIRILKTIKPLCLMCEEEYAPRGKRIQAILLDYSVWNLSTLMWKLLIHGASGLPLQSTV